MHKEMVNWPAAIMKRTRFSETFSNKVLKTIHHSSLTNAVKKRKLQCTASVDPNVLTNLQGATIIKNRVWGSSTYGNYKQIFNMKLITMFKFRRHQTIFKLSTNQQNLTQFIINESINVTISIRLLKLYKPVYERRAIIAFMTNVSRDQLVRWTV